MSLDAPIVTTEGRAKREKAVVERFAPAEAAAADDDEGLKAEGSGTALGDIDFIKEQIDKKKSDDDALTRLHSICFGKPGSKTVRKKNLRMFNGFKEEAEADAKAAKLMAQKKLTVTDLKALCEVLGVEKSGSKDAVAARVCTFLASPAAEGSKKAGAGKRKAKAEKGKKTVKAKKAKSDKPKRPLSAFMNFSNATRAAVQAENPGIAFGEVGKELGRRWGLLSDDEKAAFKSPAVADEMEADAADEDVAGEDGEGEDVAGEDDEGEDAEGEDAEGEDVDALSAKRLEAAEAAGASPLAAVAGLVLAARAAASSGEGEEEENVDEVLANRLEAAEAGSGAGAAAVAMTAGVLMLARADAASQAAAAEEPAAEEPAAEEPAAQAAAE